MSVGVDGGFVLFSSHRLPDRHPLDGETLDGLKTFGTNA